MAEPLLRVEALRKAFGGLTASDDLCLEVVDGEVHAVIGPNGAGKTTLIAQLAGALRPDGGRIVFAGRDITALPAHRRAHLGLARSFQVSSVVADFTALANVALAVQARQGHSFRFWRAVRGDERLQTPARAILAESGLAARADVPAGELAHGEQRQLEIAMALALAPRLLLLDEPMAGMGAAEAAGLTRHLASLKGRCSMLLVEHDMDAVFALADRITVLVQGRVLACGTPGEIRADPRVRRAYLGSG